MLLVSAKRYASVPHAPVVHVAGFVVLADLFVIDDCPGRPASLVVGAGGTGPVRRLGIEASHNAIQNAAENCEIVLPHLVADIGRKLFAAAPHDGDLGLVVARPQSYARMVAQPAN